MTPRAARLCMVAATLLWGATFVVIRDTLAHLDPLPLVFTRFVLAACLFAPWTARSLGARGATVWAGGVLSGLLCAGGYAFQSIGLTRTSAGSSAFLTSIGTLFAGLYAWPLLGHRPTRTLLLGIALATAGVVLLAPRGDWRPGPGEGWTLLGALAFGLEIIAVARFAPRVDPAVLTGVQALTVAVTLAPSGRRALEQLGRLPGEAWWRLGYLVLAGSVLAPLLQVVAQRSLPPGRIGLLFQLESVFALLFALTLGGERFTARWWAGSALILLAVTAVEARAARGPAASLPRASG